MGLETQKAVKSRVARDLVTPQTCVAEINLSPSVVTIAHSSVMGLGDRSPDAANVSQELWLMGSVLGGEP